MSESTPLTPPGASLVLQPPAPVAAVQPEQVGGMVPVPDAKKAELTATADAYAAELATLTPNSPELQAKITEITTLGRDEIQGAANASNRMLERPASALAAAKGSGDAGDAQARVAKTLTDLRFQVEDLTPNRADLTGARKILGFIPGGSKIARYFDRYKSAQVQLDSITRALESGQDELRKDNASIEQEKVNLWTTMGTLSEYAVLLGGLDAAVEKKIAEVEVSAPDTAKAMRSDVLFAVRQRREDILTQLAVSAQGYLAMDMVRANNVELIKGVDRARTTTLSALRTAVIVAQALTNQRLVLDQITALNRTTSDLIASNAEMLKTTSADIHRQAAASTIEIDKLEKAFQDVFATMDAIDTFRAEAASSMAVTITSLEGQIERAQPYLERAQSRPEITS
ncbi:toxic anion resistance protein [Sanguibacter inulinus]|uniref:Toxic anion resistance protein n=1 Tax=Sanguibacter inulinus TaxID=60922 RepID=A0A853ETD5_9MICO|nr:toxic anion resistance protein [Sanguibacter inulinus]MBF0722616.1 toxic anion resistance protein [Sanguibacter inulinus]NYS93761.1 toxic anion resistance protein [Sanguibacter inulinus]